MLQGSRSAAAQTLLHGCNAFAALLPEDGRRCLQLTLRHSSSTACCSPPRQRLSAGNVAKWGEYTVGPYRNTEIAGGDHYFVSTHYRAVVDVVREQLVGLMAGGLMDGHSWIEERTGAAEAPEVCLSIDSIVCCCRVFVRFHAQLCSAGMSYSKASGKWRASTCLAGALLVIRTK